MKKKCIYIAIGILIAVIILAVIGIKIFFSPKTVSEIEFAGQIVKIVDSGDGLYADEYEESRYIYKGVYPKNYVSLNNELWRIVSVDESRNIQLVRNEILENRIFDSKGYRDATGDVDGGSYCKDALDGCNAWVANEKINGKPKTITTGNFKGEVKIDSELYAYLNGEYLKTLSNVNDIISHDWNIGSVQFDADLKSQIKNEKVLKWNGKVGLITVSNYIQASSLKKCNSLTNTNNNFENCAEKNWMYINGVNWWTISPVENATIELWYIGDYGYINNDSSSQSYGVRPTIYLSSEVLFSGNGSKDNPFKLL